MYSAKHALSAVGKTERGGGVEDQRVKSRDWELGDHICCFDSKLQWVKVCLKFDW